MLLTTSHHPQHLHLQHLHLQRPAASPSPPHTDSADQSFWSEVCTLDPPHALMGVLTDLHIHRFLLHQHLATHTALTETPIGHQPLTDTLPQPIQRIIAIYHSNLQRAQYHTRLALNSIDTLARFPPAAYFTDPNFFTPAHQHIQAVSPPSNITPSDDTHCRPIPAAIQSFSMLPHRQLHHGFQSWTHTYQPQDSINPNRPPHDQTLTADTSRRTSMPLSTTQHSQVSQPHPTRSNPHLPLPTFQAPRHQPLLPPPTSNPMNAGSTSTLFPPLQSPLQHNRSTLWIFLPALAAPRATSALRPHHVRPPPPALGNQTPVQDLRSLHLHQHHVQLHNISFPQCNLSRSIHQTTPTVNPLQPVPAATGWPVFQGAATNPTPVSAPVHASPPPPHAWPSYYQVPPQQPPPSHNTASRIHDTTHEHRSVCHPIDGTPIGLL